MKSPLFPSLAVLSVLLSAPAISFGQAPAPDPTSAAQRALATAQKDLDKTLNQLTLLREKIMAEKLPMAKRQTELENKLTETRKKLESVTRDYDTRQFGLTKQATEIKLRQEEAHYLAGLLDEYIRGFETRLNVAEWDRYKKLMEEVRAAAENTSLSPAEKLKKQFEALRVSLKRAEDLVGGTQFEGQALNIQGVVEDGQFALVGPVALFSGKNGATAGIAVAQPGSLKPVVKALEPTLTLGLARITSEGSGLLPFDASRGGALKEMLGHGSLIDWFVKGGPIMWPILAASILALSVVVERIIFLVLEKRRREPKKVDEIMEAVSDGRIHDAISLGKTSKDFIVRALTYALEHRDKSLSDALVRASSSELKPFERGIIVLETIITLAPLLGLLGTVTGMMHSFGMMGGAELSAPAAITGGIAEALIATAAGLGVAIVCLLPLGFLQGRAEDARHEMEDAATHLEIMMKPVIEAESILHQQHLMAQLATQR
jgi:biopolymer transport protein ExbB